MEILKEEPLLSDLRAGREAGAAASGFTTARPLAETVGVARSVETRHRGRRDYGSAPGRHHLDLGQGHFEPRSGFARPSCFGMGVQRAARLKWRPAEQAPPVQTGSRSTRTTTGQRAKLPTFSQKGLMSGGYRARSGPSRAAHAQTDEAGDAQCSPCPNDERGRPFRLPKLVKQGWPSYRRSPRTRPPIRSRVCPRPVAAHGQMVNKERVVRLEKSGRGRCRQRVGVFAHGEVGGRSVVGGTDDARDSDCRDHINADILHRRPRSNHCRSASGSWRLPGIHADILALKAVLSC
jgi:hypothetical protein